MSEQLPFKLPVHSYIWGPNYEIRDPQNIVVFRMQVLNRGYSYLKQMEVITRIITGLMNGEMWVEQGENGYKLLAFGDTGSEVKMGQSEVPATPLPHVDIPEIPKVADHALEPEEHVMEEPAVEDDDSAPRIGGMKPKEILERQAAKRRGRKPKVK